MRCVWELGVQYLIVLGLPYEMFPLAKTLYVFFCCGAEMCVGVGGVMTICGSRFLPWNEGLFFPPVFPCRPPSSTLIVREFWEGEVLNVMAM